MARMIKSTNYTNSGIKLTTVFNDGSKTERIYMVGDIIEDLRYVYDGDIRVVTGRLSLVNYTVTNPTTWTPTNPSYALDKDMKLTNIVVDASTQYVSNRASIPVREIVEFEEETNVKRVIVEPLLEVNMTLKYSDHSVAYADIEKGDSFNNVKFLIPEELKELEGRFEVTGFAYNYASSSKLDVYGLVMMSVETKTTYVVKFENILTLTEVSEYEVPDIDALIDVIENLTDGALVSITSKLDTSDGKGIKLDKKDVEVILEKDLVADGSNTSGIMVTGEATLSGKGKVVNTTPYGAGHGSGALQVQGDGELTFNGSGVSAVITDDPVNKGQFGVTIYDNAKLTVNDGDFEAGWYCISGNGSKTSAASVTTINGGTFNSVADYAIYHPHAGKLVVNGGNISGAAGAIAANNGIIEINGGTFAVTGGGNTGDASDGTGGLGEACLNLNARYGDVVCRITGGVFSTILEADLIRINETGTYNVDLKIFGGKFSTKPNPDWIPEGYICTEERDADGFFEVSIDLANA